jgi:hypothetical protein
MREMTSHVNRLRGTWLLLSAAAGALAFFFIQIYPTLLAGTHQGEFRAPLGKSEAERSAVRFVQETFGIHAVRSELMYRSESEMIGYLQQQKKLDDYLKSYDERFPLDYYVVRLTDETSRSIDVRVHLYTGEVIGWHWTDRPAHPQGSWEENVEKAKEIAASQGFAPARLELDARSSSSNTVEFKVSDVRVGDAGLRLTIGVDHDEAVTFAAGFQPPASYKDYIQRQNRWASWMTYAGSLLVTALMTIAALLIALRHRKQLSFSRGLVLALLFFAIYLANNYNMYPGILAVAGKEEGAAFTLVMMNLFAIGMTVSLYAALVAGEGLWRKAGWSEAWPRFRDRHFGEQVISGMVRGYLFAAIVLGVQSFMFLLSAKAFGMFTTSDPASSPLNMRYAWVYPLLAWAAAIQEEAFYRMYGIALFQRAFGRPLLAAFIPAVVWAFGHTSYPVYPVYTRVLELTVIGLMFAWIFLRHGFVTAVFTHAIVNSVLMGINLIMLASWTEMVAGFAHMVLPAAVAAVLVQAHRMRNGRKPAV